MSIAAARTMPHSGPGYGEREDRPVDLVHLTQHSLGDRQLEQEILRLFVRQSTIYLQRLREASTSAELSSAAHTIKGSARGIGAWRVAHLAEAIENPPAADSAMAHDLVGDLERAVEETNSYIGALIGDS